MHKPNIGEHTFVIHLVSADSNSRMCMTLQVQQWYGRDNLQQSLTIFLTPFYTPLGHT